MRRDVPITLALCVGVWVLARWVVFDFFQLGDTRVYEHAARLMDAGAVPYRDFDIEYPPLATLSFWAVGRAPGDDFQLAFSMTMLACLAATALAALVIARHVGLGRARTWIAVTTIALTPLLLGTLLQTRYDLMLSALLGWTLVAALHRRFAWAWALLAIATAVKLVPVLLVPALVVWHRRHRSLTPALRGLAGMAGVVAATFAPFLAIAPNETLNMFRYHLDRPLQLESAGSAALHVSGANFRGVNSYGSDNVVGGATEIAATLSTLLVIVGVLAVAWTLARLLRRDHAPDGRFLVMAFGASVALVILFGKVISPQYLVWLLPMALLVPGVGGQVGAIAFTLALPLTQLVFPLLYPALIERTSTLPVWLLTARNALLAVLVVALWPRGRPAEADTPRPTLEALLKS